MSPEAARRDPLLAAIGHGLEARRAGDRAPATSAVVGIRQPVAVRTFEPEEVTMGRKILLLGVALAALWVVLTVTRAVVGGALWLVLAAAVVALIIGAAQAVRGGASRRGLGDSSGLGTRRRTHA